MLEDLTQQVRTGAELSSAEIAHAVEALVAETLDASVKADFLTALAQRGETPAEIAALARELRGLSLLPPIDTATRERGILDVCGTGGDHQNTFNISTTVAILVASAGVPVAKHGNRAVTSKSGSADVLEALGIRVDLAPDEAAQWLRERQFAFFFAPRFHPAFKHLAPARRLCAERGQRTVFNLLGPLLNPARPSAQLVGVSSPTWCEPLARVLQELGVQRAMVVSGRAGEGHLDELSTVGENVVAEFHHARGFSVSTLSPRLLPVQPAVIGDLAGGDREVNAAIIRRLLAGQERGPRREAVLLNAAAALFVAGRARSITDGWGVAEELLDSGRGAAQLARLQQ